MKSRARFPGLRQFILIFAIAAPVWTIFFIQQNLLLALVPLFVSHALLLYPTLYPAFTMVGTSDSLFRNIRKRSLDYDR